MDVLLPCSSLSSVNLKPDSGRRFLSPNRNRRFSDLLKCRRKTTSTELQAAIDVAGRTDNGSASIPTHKVTVHDRQRGVVHEFVVPEVRHQLIQFCGIDQTEVLNSSWWIIFYCLMVAQKCRISTYCTLPKLRAYLFLLLAGTVLFPNSPIIDEICSFLFKVMFRKYVNR